MSALGSTIVDWNTLGKVALASLVSGVGVTVVFSLAIVGAARFEDMRRDGRAIEAGAYAVLLALSVAGLAWAPLLATVPLLALAVGAVLVDAGLGAARSAIVRASPSRAARLRAAGLVALLYVLQPLARLYGRLGVGLTPLRRRGPRGLSWPVRWETMVWDEHWSSPEARLEAIEERLRAMGAAVHRGDAYARWDLEVLGGALGAARLRMAVEEHGAGRQLTRFRGWPRPSPTGLAIGLALGALSADALADRAWVVGCLLAAAALALLARIAQESAGASGALVSAIRANPGAAAGRSMTVKPP
jgi:hypothetical protein